MWPDSFQLLPKCMSAIQNSISEKSENFGVDFLHGTFWQVQPLKVLTIPEAFTYYVALS